MDLFYLSQGFYSQKNFLKTLVLGVIVSYCKIGFGIGKPASNPNSGFDRVGGEKKCMLRVIIQKDGVGRPMKDQCEGIEVGGKNLGDF